MYQLAIFDLDGTILYTLEDLVNSVNAALTSHGYPTHTTAEIRSYLGTGTDNLIRQSLPEGVSEEERLAVTSDYRKHYGLHYNDATKPYQGMPALLDALKRAGMKLAVLTNKMDDVAQELCESHFPGVFDVVQGQKAGTPLKPSPVPVQQVLARLAAAGEVGGVSEVDAAAESAGSAASGSEADTAAAVLETAATLDPSQCVYIGDSEVDMNTGINSGMDYISCDWGYRDRKYLEEVGSQHLVSTMEELEAALLK